MTEPPRPPPSFDVAVIGAGAAGLMAGYWAARRRRRVILLEGSRACAQKIPISGGGRCNVLPEDVQEGDFFTSGSRNVLRRLLRTWPRLEVERFFLEELSMPLTLERKTRKLFPESESGRAVRDRLVAAASDAGAEIAVRWRVARVDAVKPRGFLIAGPGGERIAASRVIIATGGMSLPKTGSDGAGYRLARALGHSIISPYPALVPLTSDDPGFRELAGVSLPVRWRALLGGRLVDEGARELLFTHRGFSGPAILDASHWAVRDGASIEVSWGGQTRGEWLARWRGAERRGPVSLVAAALPRRLAEELCRRAGLTGEHRLGNLTREQREGLLGVLCGSPLPVTGNEGYRTAEVTGGGIPLGELNPSTLESRATPGLYLCGEILDAIGPIGGYNFLWAWITGRLAGESAGGR